jgi:hypothetical protein
LKALLRIIAAIGVVVALEVALHYVYGQKQNQAMAGPQQRQLQDQNGQNQSSSNEGKSVHHPDLDNRADLIGVEQGFMRGATVFVDPGYRDYPNAAQMQILPAP